ncbi:BON domain-containing protein [Noviherbaspirillum sp. 1P10PC]|uniref:BON domain-containing protein n=1 Tax=Noviherbaspirillum sp. 1P10PC TaxID=3132292 RepID=UPI0039A1562C
MKNTTRTSALMMALLLSTAMLGACKKADDTAATPATTGTTATTTTTTTTPAAPAAPAATDTTTAPAADSAAAAANNAAAAANNAASAAGAAAANATDKAGDALGDSAITGKVKAALLADAEVKGTDINVETNKGDVMLSGFVESQAQIDKAATLAKNIDGVKQVSNKLEIKK